MGPQGPVGKVGASYVTQGLTATNLTLVGAGVALTKTANSTASIVNSTGNYVQIKTSATNGNTASFTNTNVVQGQLNPILKTTIQTYTTIASQRIWIALTSASLSTTDAVGASTIKFVGVRYSTSAGDTNFQCVSGNGTTASAIDTGVAVTANTSYTIELDWSSPSTLICKINNQATTKTTNLESPATTNLGIHTSITNLGTSIVGLGVAYIKLLFNGSD
jgi:hypothetical protein